MLSCSRDLYRGNSQDIGASMMQHMDAEEWVERSKMHYYKMAASTRNKVFLYLQEKVS